MDQSQSFSKVTIPAGHQLRRKETFEYTTPQQVYDIELFTEQSGECYAIGVSREGRLIVYGSPVLDNPQAAIQTVIQKIQKEGFESTTFDDCV